MFRKFKLLGLAMVALLAMSAFVASAAQAQFTANSYPTTGTATSSLNDDFNTEAGSVECSAHFQGTLNEASTTFTVTPTYYNCQAFGFSTATVSMNGCDYVFHRQSETSSIVTLSCPAGKSVVIATGNCELQIGSQLIAYTETANSGNRVLSLFHGSLFSYTVTKDGFLCPFSGTGVKSNGHIAQGYPVMFTPVSGGTDLTID